MNKLEPWNDRCQPSVYNGLTLFLINHREQGVGDLGRKCICYFFGIVFLGWDSTMRKTELLFIGDQLNFDLAPCLFGM